MLDRPLTIPLRYHYILQSAVQGMMSVDSELGARVHDEGLRVDGRPMKPYVLSLLKGGKADFQNKTLTFTDSLYFYFDSPFDFLSQTIQEACDQKGIRLGHTSNHFKAKYTILDDPVFTKGRLKVKTLSPITVYRTLMKEGRKFTQYYSPLEEEFEILIQENFEKKYKGYFEKEAEETIGLEVVKVSSKDKYVTRYGKGEGGIWITAWDGIFELRGGEEALKLLYQSGLGVKNAQAFGMVEVL